MDCQAWGRAGAQLLDQGRHGHPTRYGDGLWLEDGLERLQPAVPEAVFERLGEGAGLQ